MEEIDILLATYNGEKYLNEQIESILNQTYKNFRLIIYDDCSTDDTLKILEKYKQVDNRIIVYRQEENVGYVKNFEMLLEKVENDIYMLSDQDDVWLPNKIEESLKTLREQKADLVYTDLEVVDENLNVIYPSFTKYRKTFDKAKKYNDYRAVFLYNLVTGCTIISKKAFINKILPLPKNKYMPHDFWLALNVAINGKIYFLEKPYIMYRQHGNNQIGSKKTTEDYKSFKQVRDLFVDVKINIFTTYVQNNKSFPNDLKELSKNALNYFNSVKDIKYINFKDWKTFNDLYKYDNFKYYIINFIIINIPILGSLLYKFKMKG